MRKPIFWIPALAAIFAPHSGFAAGVDSSGGGKGIVCRAPNGHVKSVELLDLWEAKNIYQRKIQESAQPVAQQVATAIDRMKFSLDFPETMDGNGQPQPGSAYVLNNLRWEADRFLKGDPSVVRMHNTTLEPTPDGDEPATPEGCKVEQLVNYMDSWTNPRILVDQDLVDHMDRTNQAALITHEAFYYLLRTLSNEEKTSTRARRAVGYVFAGDSFPALADLLGNEYVLCNSAEGSDWSRVYFYKDSDGNLQNIAGGIFGRANVGFFQGRNPFVQPNSLEAFVTGAPCTEMNDNGYIPNEMTAAGPVDFQNEDWVMFSCPGGKAAIHISDERQNINTAQLLTCQLVKK